MAIFFRTGLPRCAAFTLLVVGAEGCDFTGDVSLGNEGRGGSDASGGAQSSSGGTHSSSGGTRPSGGTSSGGSRSTTGGVAGDGEAGAPSGGSGNGGSGNASAGGSGNASAGGSGNASAGGSGNASAGGSGNASAGGSGNASAGGLGGSGNAGSGGLGGSGNAGSGGSGRAGSGGSGNAGSGGGSVTSYLGCSFIGGVNRIVVSKRDRANDRCLGLVLWAPMTNSNEDIALPEHYAVEAVVVGPADECPSRLATRVEASVSGAVTVVDTTTPSSGSAAHVAANVTITLAGSQETLRVESVDVRPMCNNVCGTGPGYLCNDNPMISSIHGRCTPAGNCVCDQYEMNPETGRCY